MEDNLFWTRNGERQWLRGFGFYHQTYVREADGQWRFSYRKLERTRAETSAAASIPAADFSGEPSRRRRISHIRWRSDINGHKHDAKTAAVAATAETTPAAAPRS